MAKEKSHQIQKLWENVNGNESDIEKLSFNKIETTSYTITKVPQVINVLEKYQIPYPLLGTYAIEIVVPFETMPSWALSGVHGIPLIYSTGLLPPENSPIFTLRFLERWQELNESYIYRAYVYGIAYTESYNLVPIYIDFDILIENNSKYVSQQGYKI